MLRPRDVTGMGVWEEGQPVLTRQLGLIHPSTLRRLAAPAATVREGACVARVLEEVHDPPVQCRAPGEIALAGPGVQSPGKQDLLRMQAPHRRHCGTGAPEGLENSSDSRLDLLVGVKGDFLIGVVDQADWKSDLQLSTVRLVQDAALQPTANHV